MDKKISIRKTIVYVSMFLILLYPFNATIDTIIYPNNTCCLASILLGTLGLILTRKKIRIKKNIILVLIVTLIAVLMSFVNNYYLIEGRGLRVILFIIYLFIPLIFYINQELEEPFYKMLRLFSIEHIIGTFIGILFKKYYSSVVLAKLCSGKVICTAIGNNYHGYMTGFTTHFSTNAIYLSIASLLFFSCVLYRKDKKNILLFALSMIALFTTGKRAHLTFTIVCCLLVYLVQKSKNVIKKYTKLVGITFFSICTFILLSKYIPEMTNILVRFGNLIEKGNIMNGRTELYDLAFKMWDRHLIFGNGWGSFSYFYQTTLFTSGSMSYLDAHNVFIQLLCETGIVGFTFFIVNMLNSLIKSLKKLKKHQNTIMNNFSFAYQIFFILYCFTGNPLYDPMCYVVYFAVIGLTIINQKEEGKKL